MNKLRMSQGYDKYFEELTREVNQLYSIAKEARSKGLDQTLEPEPELTYDIAERIEKLIGPVGITQRMRDLENMDRNIMAFRIAGEIAEGYFGELNIEDAADQAIRTALAIMTEGVTIAPIQGIPQIKVKQNIDKTQYLAVYFAGPIRPAGGTAQALTLVVADQVRRKLGLERYRPTDEAIGRFVEEVRLYEREVRRFQYHVTDEDIELALRNLTVEATGVSTDPYEVSNFRDVVGVETNRVRGGSLIVVVDGIVGRARKLLGICEGLKIDGWDWLSQIDQGASESEDSAEKKSTASFMEEIIVGRPVFSFPSREGGFRLRYGRARTTGLAAVGVHPATMIILNKFLCTGVQLRIELPGKSASITPVDSIEPAVVKLKDGSLRRVETEAEAVNLLGEVETILSLGDILINAGDFIQNNKNLLKSGYDENQWHNDLKYNIEDKIPEVLVNSVFTHDRLVEFLKNKREIPSSNEAIYISTFGVPLHPRYTYNWSSVSTKDVSLLRNELISQQEQDITTYSLSERTKSTLETLLVPHEVKDGKIVLSEAFPILERCLDLDNPKQFDDFKSTLEMVRSLSGFDIREKAPIYVGARMGRPEKAKERKMSPYVHGLFPVGSAGGPQRDILRAEKGRKTSIQIINKYCPQCGAVSFGVKCPICDEHTVVQKRCQRCGRELEGAVCPICKIETVSSHTTYLDLQALFNAAWKKIGGQRPQRLKCVRGLLNKNKTPEPLEKGLLRATYDLSVFKDGTLRYDLTDVPLTHFIPMEIGTNLETLKELGYVNDIDGSLLKQPNQMLELKVQDVILPESCGDYLVKASKFIDDLLKKFYGMKPYYNAKNRGDIIGQLIHGLAPHTSATIIGRVIGYTKTRVCYAHPLWHAAKRRNCDGDEDGIMIGLDPLLNFSREFLPERSGGLMDAPLYVIPVLNPSEVDKEAHNLDVNFSYPPDFYEMCVKGASPSEYGTIVDTIGRRLDDGEQLQNMGYTEDCSNINLGAHSGAYNTLTTMLDKLESQLDLSEKIRAVDAKIVAQKVLTSHFMKDIVGNLRAFTRQRFRCVACNRKYRRPPLKGVCLRCGGKLSLTVYKGGIEKYLNPALDLVKRYELETYYSDRLGLVKDEIKSIFLEKEEEIKGDKQISLIDFMKR